MPATASDDGVVLGLKFDISRVKQTLDQVKNIGAGNVVHCAFWIVHTRKINTHLARCKRIKLSLFTFVCIKQVD